MKRERRFERLSISIACLAAAALYGLVLASAGCGGGGGTGVGGNGEPVECSAGAEQSCTCPNGTSGHSSCSDGQWQACACTPSTPDMGCAGQIDTLGKCCSGDSCCAAVNHSQASGGSCVCASGYVEGPSFGSNNDVCVAALPDLVSGGWSLTYTPPTTASTTMSICINQNPNGTTANNGDYVKVDDDGQAAAGAFHVGLGIEYLTTGEMWWAQNRLTDDGLAVGAEASWTNPYCMTFTTAGLPAGDYTLVEYVDIDQQVVESDETNNITSAAGSFYVYGK